MAPWPTTKSDAPSRPRWCRAEHELPRIEIPGATLVRVPSDGNCMFTAYYMGVSKKTDYQPHEMAEQGRNTRAFFLRRVTQAFSAPHDKMFGDLPLYSILLDIGNIDAGDRSRPVSKWPEAQTYLTNMSKSATRASWGGVAELHVLAHMSERKIYLVEHHHDGKWQLFLPPIGPKSPSKPPVCVAWSGGHYDAVMLPDDAWSNLYPGFLLHWEVF